MSAAETLERLDNTLKNMTPDEYAKDRVNKRLRTQLIRQMEKRNHPTEHQEQVELFRWADLNHSKYPELEKMYAVPNGGKRDKKVAAKLQAEGVKTGVFDVNLDVARGEFFGLRLELKTLVGSLSREQRIWMQRFTEEGYCARCAKGVQEAIKVIEWYLSLPKVEPGWSKGL